MILTRHPSLRLACILSLVVCVLPAGAQFVPPHIVYVINPDGAGHPSDARRTYLIDKGVESNINKGDILNVYREKRAHASAPGVRLFIGTMQITSSRNGSCMGLFTPNESAISSPLIRHQKAMKSDIVVPFRRIDAEVLFDPASIQLSAAAAGEFQSLEEFLTRFEPNRVVVEGHTDTQGDLQANQLLSEARAEAVRQYLIENLEFITPGMIESRGYGGGRPTAPNDTPDGRALNRRIEIIVWE